MDRKIEAWVLNHLEAWLNTVYLKIVDDERKAITKYKILEYIRENPEELEKNAWHEITQHAGIELY